MTGRIPAKTNSGARDNNLPEKGGTRENRMSFMTRSLLTGTAMAMTLSTAAIADEFRLDRLFVVGDSLSDGGAYSQAVQAGAALNNQTVPDIRYRFTDNRLDGSSRTYAEVLADELGIALEPNLITGVPATAGTPLSGLANDVEIGGGNYAQGGSRVSRAALDDAQRAPFGITQTPVTTQVERLLANGRTFDANDLVILWAGANDVLANSALVGAGARTPQDAGQAVGVAATQMVGQVERVLGRGASNVVVVTVPDIGANTPLGTGSTPQGRALLSGLTDTYNGILQNGVGGRVTLVDSNAVLSDVLDNPTRYGFSAVNQRATVECAGSSLNCIAGPGGNAANDGTVRVFADPVHPSTQAHLILGQIAASALVDIGQVGVMPVATISALRQQSLGLEQRLNLGAFFINDDTGTRVRRPVGNVEIYGGAEVGFYESDAQQVVPGFDAATQVVKAAADVMVTPNIMLGIGGSVDHGQVEFEDDRGGFDSRLYVGGVFGVAQIIPGVYANAFLGGGLIDIYDIERNYDIRGLDGGTLARESFEADTDGTYFIARTNLGAVLPVGNGFFVNPSVGFAYERVDIDGYSENARGETMEAAQATIGDLEYVGYRGTLALGGFYRPPSAPGWTFGLRASWEHDFNDDDIEVPFGVGTVPLNTQTAPRPDDSYGLLAATVVRELSHSTSLNIGASAAVGQDGVQGYTASLVFKHSF